MNVLMISTDRNIFKEGSEARARMARYGALADELYIIVLTRRRAGCAQTQIASNVRVYPTDSRSRWRYVFDAARIGKKLVAPTLVTAQDPFECGLAGWRVARHFKAPLQLQIHTDFLSPYCLRESFLNKIRVRI
ncbi:hypothetical protein HYR65_02955, partial [Candidatus Azambacteria bacterium]|nr:hypothetical protein [Candidatus Azambacteria bacterium]